MKSFFKKLIITMSAMSITLAIAASAVSATQETVRPIPGSTSTSVTDGVTDSDSNDKTTIAKTGGAEGPQNVTTQASNSTVTEKKYLTKWGGFFFLLITVIINFILSCWISNRFYRLAKRNTQGSAEIRALRKDIEEKFAATLTNINEPITEVINNNESYARNDEGMEMPERKSTVEIKEDEREILGRWDMKRAAAKEAEAEDDTYEMRRPMAGIQFEDSEDEQDAEATPSRSKIEKAGNKAKDFLSNIFPFEDQ